MSYYLLFLSLLIAAASAFPPTSGWSSARSPYSDAASSSSPATTALTLDLDDLTPPMLTVKNTPVPLIPTDNANTKSKRELPPPIDLASLSRMFKDMASKELASPTPTTTESIATTTMMEKEPCINNICCLTGRCWRLSPPTSISASISTSVA